ncbi:MAG TPA: ATP-binding protein [Streptosporangiaceae bacterium]|nr:ATP-binding protein [Streptosporangiaceae bacterium]
MLRQGPFNTAASSIGVPAGQGAQPGAAVHMQRALMRLALLMRAVPLLQALATLLFGFSAYQRPWLGVAAGCAAVAWSNWLALRVWPTGRCPVPVCVADVTVAVTALLAVGAATPPQSLTTSFYWAVAYAAATAVLLGLSLPPRVGGFGLAALLTTYGLVVGLRAGIPALPAAAGNAAGCTVYFGCGVLAAWYVRRLTNVVAQAEAHALTRQARLGVRQARLDEFGRLHDDAVQVLERVAAADERDAAELRAHAATAAAHLRAAIEDRGAECGSLGELLRRVADGFASLRFSVTVDCVERLPDPGAQVILNLAAAVTEALNNAYKHSGATCAVVRAALAGGGIEVSVEDSGAGFATGSCPEGFGITNSIRRRLVEAGGKVEVCSAPGMGTAVRMWLPC